MNLIQRIHEDTPGLTLRVALQRWLLRRPGGLAHIARALEMDPKDVQAWLNDDESRLVVAANVRLLSAQPAPKKNKPGPKTQGLDPEKRRRLKRIGAHRYAEELLAERKRDMGLAT